MRAFLFPGSLFVSFPTPSAAARLQAEQPRQFTETELELIRAYYQQTADKVTDLVARAKKFVRGEPLIPGAVKRLLPKALDAQLPELDPDYERVIVDGRVLLIDIHAELVHDLVNDLYVEV
jgi:hypothetical protein